MKRILAVVAAICCGLLFTVSLQASPKKPPIPNPVASTTSSLEECRREKQIVSALCAQQIGEAKFAPIAASAKAVATTSAPPAPPAPPPPPPPPMDPVCEKPATADASKKCVCPKETAEVSYVLLQFPTEAKVAPRFTCVVRDVRPAKPKEGLDKKEVEGLIAQALKGKVDDKVLNLLCPPLAEKPNATLEERCAAAQKGGRDVSKEIEALCPALSLEPGATMLRRCQAQREQDNDGFWFSKARAIRGKAFLDIEADVIASADEGDARNYFARTELGGRLTARFGVWPVPRYAVFVSGSGQSTHGYNVGGRFAGCAGVGALHLWTPEDASSTSDGVLGLRIDVPIFCQYVSHHAPPYKGQTERGVGVAGPGLNVSIVYFFKGQKGVHLSLGAGGALRKEGHIQDDPKQPYAVDGRWHFVPQANFGIGVGF